jgi:hypothetical protein
MVGTTREMNGLTMVRTTRGRPVSPCWTIRELMLFTVVGNLYFTLVGVARKSCRNSLHILSSLPLLLIYL